MNKKCKECRGACCKIHDYIELVSMAEIKRLVEAAKKHEVPLKLVFSPARERWFMEAKARCEFLHHGKCLIYDERPKACRVFECTTGDGYQIVRRTAPRIAKLFAEDQKK